MQDGVEAEPAPDLQADMHRTGFAMRFAADAGGIDRNRRGARARPAGARLDDPLGHFRVARIEQVVLADQGGFDLVRQLKPVLARARAQVAERADHLLAGPLGGADGLDQQVIGIGPPLHAAPGLADEHGLYST